LGRHVVRQAIAARHEVAVVVRTPAKLPADVLDKVSVHPCDLSAVSTSDLTSMLAGHDAVINTAGLVTEGQVFVDLVDRLVTSLEAISTIDRPACWFLAGAALLDIDGSGRRGVDLPRIDSTYWSHRVNFERIRRSNLDWRLLCPGPMVEQPPLGLAKLRISLDRLPVRVPAFGHALPGAFFLPVFAYLVPEMIVPYPDAAALMLENSARGGGMSHHRVGLALPLGMRGRKDQWTARPKHGRGIKRADRAAAGRSSYFKRLTMCHPYGDFTLS
jgi:putative NADH-flavin reductase